MRRKRLFVLMMAGALTVGAVPSAAFAAEEGSPVSVESELTAASEAPGEVPAVPETEGNGGAPAEAPETSVTETPQDTPVPQLPTEIPAPQTPSDTPVPETPSDTPVSETPTEAPAETPSAAPTEEPQENPEEHFKDEEPQEEPSVTPSAEPNQDKAAAVKIGDEQFACDTLAEALSLISEKASGDAATIYLNKDMEIDSSVTIGSGKRVILTASAENVRIKRAAGFTGDMFVVSSGGTLGMGGGSGRTVTVDGALAEGSAAGSLVNVSEGGSFVLSDGAVLTGNVTSAQGSAVNAAANTTVSLVGGSITGNTTTAENGGAVYGVSGTDASGSGAVSVMGGISIENNKGKDDKATGIVLSEGSALVILGELTNSISLKVIGAAENSQVLMGSETGQVTESVVSKITYDDASLKIDAAGKLVSAEATVTPGPETTVTPGPETTVTPEPETSGTPSPEKPEAGEIRQMKALWVNRNDGSGAELTFSVSKAGKLYIAVTNKDDIAENGRPQLNDVKARGMTLDAAAGDNFCEIEDVESVKLKDSFSMDKIVILCVWFEPSDGGDPAFKRLDFSKKDRNLKLTVTGEGERISEDQVKFDLVSNKDGGVYAVWAEEDAETDVDCEGEPDVQLSADAVSELTLSDVPAGLFYASFRMKAALDDNREVLSVVQVVPVAAYQAVTPSPEPTETPWREPIISKVGDSKIYGLEEPFEYIYGSVKTFQVEGAGYSTSSMPTPWVKGDVRWKPEHWSLTSDPTTDIRKLVNNVGYISMTNPGKVSAKTYPLYVYYRKQVYNGTAWEDQQGEGDAGYIRYYFSIVPPSSSSSPTPTGTGYGGSGYGGSGYGGSGYWGDDYNYDPDDPSTWTADGSVTGTETTKTPAKTSDETPLGNFLALAFASILAAGFVLFEKRRTSKNHK